MARKASRVSGSELAHPEDRHDHSRRARVEVDFEEQHVLGALFGEFDANLVQIENRLGVYIAARGDKVQIEGQEDDVARARDVLRAMHEKLLTGTNLDAGLIESLIAMSQEPTLDGIIKGGDGAPQVMIRTRKKTITPRSATQVLVREVAHAAADAVQLQPHVRLLVVNGVMVVPLVRRHVAVACLVVERICNASAAGIERCCAPSTACLARLGSLLRVATEVRGAHKMRASGLSCACRCGRSLTTSSPRARPACRRS